MATVIRTQAVPPAIQRVREVLVRRSGICPVSLVGDDGTDIISDVSPCLPPAPRSRVLWQ
jgi:hypothetical protein